MVEIWLGGRFGYMAGEYFVTTVSEEWALCGVRTAGFVEIDDNLFKLIEMSL